MDDAALLTAVASGDRAAFTTLVERHEASVWRVVRVLTDSEAAAEDALQETFLAAWRGAADWRGEGPVRAWLLGLARRQAARTWRRRVGEPVHPEPLEELGALAGWGRQDDPEAWAQVLEDQRRLYAALGRLSPEDRAVIVLRDLEQLSGPEAAAALQLPLAALKSRLHRARLRLMAELRPEVSHV